MKINSTSVHHFLKAALLLGFSIYVLSLTLSGDILQFIVPQLVIYVKIAAIFLLFISGIQFYIAILSLKKQVIICDCGHDHGHDHIFGHDHDHKTGNSLGKHILIYGLFVFPLALGFFLPNHTLSSNLVASRGMNLGSLPTQTAANQGAAVELSGNEDPELKQKFSSNVYDQNYAKLGMILYKQNVIEMKDKWFIEKLQSMNTFVDNFQDKKIKIKGFIYRESGLGSNQFIIARMGMTHCINDISPFGIIAEAANSNQFANDSWVTITGTIKKTTFNGQSVLMIEVENSQPAKSPSVPYVYPDWDFGKKL